MKSFAKPTNGSKKTTMKLYYTLLLTLIGFFSFGQSFMITNVTVFDGEKVHENTSVLVKDGKIIGVSVHLESDAEVIDGSGKFLMPGMTNSHVHAWAATSLSEAVKAGVVNLLDMHGVEGFQPAMRALKDSTGFARFYYAGFAATAPEGHGTQYGFPVPTLASVDDAGGFVSDRLKAGAHYIKIIEEPWKPTLSHEIVKAVIDAAHDQNTIAVVHISKVDDAYKVLSNNANGLVHIWWDEEMPESQLTELTKNKEFFVIPTLLTSQRALKSIRQRAPDTPFLSDEGLMSEVKRLYEAGVPILAGTDPPNVGINYGTDLYEEMKLLSRSGIPNTEVLKSATSYPATFFRLDGLGYIKPGYAADLVLLEKSPLDNMDNLNSVEMIWKDGKEVVLNDE